MSEVAKKLGMSGECLCGASAAPGEFERIEKFYPENMSKRYETYRMRQGPQENTARGAQDQTPDAYRKTYPLCRCA